MLPLSDAQERFVFCNQVLRVDESPFAMLDSGVGKTKRAYIWANARGVIDAPPGVVYDFCVGRGAQFPIAGQRAVVAMSLVQSAKLNGHHIWAYLKNVLTRLPTQFNSRIDELLPHNWWPA